MDTSKTTKAQEKRTAKFLWCAITIFFCFLIVAAAGRSPNGRPAKLTSVSSGLVKIKTPGKGGGSACEALVPAAPVTHNRPDTAVQHHIRFSEPDQLSTRLVGQFCADEYRIIKRAADRNGCRGDDFVILLAIRKAENGRAGCEFGVKHPRAWETNLDTQAGWAAATIVKNRKRFNLTTHSTGSGQAGREGFINFLADRYCPAENDAEGNVNFKSNVKFFYSKYRGVEQRPAQWAHNPQVEGSNPSVAILGF